MERGLVELLLALEAKTNNVGQACDFFHADSSDVSAAINSTFLKLHRLREIITEIQQIREKRDENNTKIQFLSEFFSERSADYASICDSLPERFKEEQLAMDERLVVPSEADTKKLTKLVKKAVEEKNPTSKAIPQVKYITLDQFESIPKYMKGRLSYDSINTSVEEFNKALKSKYEFLRKGFPTKGSLADKNRYKELRSHETKATTGQFFLVADNMRPLSTLKNENSRRVIFPIFRHLQMLKEIRGPGSIVRFAVA